MKIFARDLKKKFVDGGDPKKYDQTITNEPKRAIRSIFYINDFDGDENFHLFAVDALTSSFDDSTSDSSGSFPPARDLTPGKDVKAQNIITNYRYPDQIFVGTNECDPKSFDMYRVFYKLGGRRRTNRSR